MKKSLIITALLVGATGAYAQGTVNFGPKVTGSYTMHIYGPQPGSLHTEVIGNGSTDLPSGTTVYAAGTGIGGTGAGTGLANGLDFTVELYGAPGNAVSGGFAGLSPLTQYVTTASSKLAGSFFSHNPSGDPGIPGGTASLGATVALAVWYTGGGDTTLAAAQADTASGMWGTSSLSFLPNLGGFGSPPSVSPALGIPSFSLVTNTVPEPSTIALGVIGAASFLIRRRK